MSSNLNYFSTVKNQNFVNRQYELGRLAAINQKEEASIIVVSGRRRIGKTELIEQFFIASNLLKFEGVQPDTTKKRSFQEELRYQIKQSCKRLAKYSDQPAIAKLSLENWSDFFEILVPIVQDKQVVLYFEELQWLANYSDRFTAELKPFWDDCLRHNPKLRIVFSGSAPSFLTKQFLYNSALYNRSSNSIFLDEFTLSSTKEYFNNFSLRETLTAQLLVGGVPEYLKQLQDSSASVLQNLISKSCKKDGFFFEEYNKIFVSSMSTNKHYQEVIELLSSKKYCSRKEILKYLGVSSSGTISQVLEDLEKCGFIDSYTPLDKENASRSVRYCIKDAYINFYNNFIRPQKAKILRGSAGEQIVRNFSKEKIAQTLGYSFERWCRFNSDLLAKCMSFEQVEYQSGSYFSRKLEEEGFQFDLIYRREDNRLVICEIKYSAPHSPGKIFQKMQEQSQVLKKSDPKKFSRHTTLYALIVGEELDDKTSYLNHFDYVLDLKDFVSQN